MFSLVTHTSEVDGQVTVSRLPRTAEAVQAELDEVRAAPGTDVGVGERGLGGPVPPGAARL